MTDNNRLKFLCDAMESQRKLTNWYIAKIPEELLGKRINANGIPLNAPAWIMAHLVWTEYYIALGPLQEESAPPEWIQEVRIGTSGDLPDILKDQALLRRAFDGTHEKKISLIRSLDDRVLDQPYEHASMRFPDNYRALLHLLRHEGVHCGHFSLICKLSGITTV